MTTRTPFEDVSHPVLQWIDGVRNDYETRYPPLSCTYLHVSFGKIDDAQLK